MYAGGAHFDGCAKLAMLIGLCHLRSIANRAASEILTEALRWCDRRLILLFILLASSRLFIL